MSDKHPGVYSANRSVDLDKVKVPTSGTAVVNHSLCESCGSLLDVVRVHELKTWPEHFAGLADGTKTFEIRKNDRGFRVGDILVLREWSKYTPPSEHYSGREFRFSVTYILKDTGFLQPGYVCMGIQKHKEPWRGAT